MNAKKQIIDASVEQKTIYEEDDCLHCGLCSFSSKSKKNILRHSNLVHGVVINDKVGHYFRTKRMGETDKCSVSGLSGRRHDKGEADSLLLHSLQVPGSQQGGAGPAPEEDDTQQVRRGHSSRPHCRGRGEKGEDQKQLSVD